MTVLFAARELPELVSLADDVTNDGQVLESVYQEQTSAMHLSSERADPVSTFPVVSANLPQCSAGVSPAALSAETGQDLIRLLSLQRE